jgi:hypothetical protein
MHSAAQHSEKLPYILYGKKHTYKLHRPKTTKCHQQTRPYLVGDLAMSQNLIKPSHH